MNDIAQTIDLCTSILADGLSAAVANVVDNSVAVSNCRRALVTGATIHALLGPKLTELVKGVGADIERKTVERFQAALEHPRYGREPIIDELENAEVAFNEAVLAAQRDTSLANIVAVLLARIRLNAVTTAVGEACVVPPIVDNARGRTGRRQRRRKITADDVPNQIKELVCRAAFDDEHYEDALAELGDLCGSEIDRGGIVTKIVTLAQLHGGRKFVNEMATRIKRASPDSAEPADVAVPSKQTRTSAALTAPAPIAVPQTRRTAAPIAQPIPMVKAQRVEATVIPVRLNDLSTADRQLLFAIADASAHGDKSTFAIALGALRESAIKIGNSAMLEMCTEIDGGHGSGKLSRLLTTLRQQGAITPEPKPQQTAASRTPQVAKTVAAEPLQEQRPGYLTSSGVHVEIIAVESPADNLDDPRYRDGADERAVPEFLAWLKERQPGFTGLLDRLPDGTIVRGEAMQAPTVIARFERAGRHPLIQAKLVEMMRQSTEIGTRS